MKKLLLLAFAFASLSALHAQQIKTEVYDYVLWQGDTIHFTLCLNLDATKPEQIVIIIPGSGPTDRDGNSGMLPGNNNAYKQLADSLRSMNIASIRYDKPGVGESKYGKEESAMRFEHNAQVVSLLIEKAKKLSDKVYLLGHSEGSTIALLTAQQQNVAGIISVAGPAQNAKDVLISQIQSSGFPPALKVQVAQKLDSIAQGHPVPKFHPMLSSILRVEVQPYLQSWFAYTPMDMVKSIETPILVIQGEADLQVPAASAEALDHHAPNSELVLIPQMNHVMKKVETEEANMASYGSPEYPLHPVLLSAIKSWMSRH